MKCVNCNLSIQTLPSGNWLCACAGKPKIDAGLALIQRAQGQEKELKARVH